MSTQRWCLIVLGMSVALGVTAIQSSSVSPPIHRSAESKPKFPAGWEPASPRDEIRPTFSFDPKGGPKGDGAFVIAAADSVGQHGWFQKAFPVTGGKFYRFSGRAQDRERRGAAAQRRRAHRLAGREGQGRPRRRAGRPREGDRAASRWPSRNIRSTARPTSRAGRRWPASIARRRRRRRRSSSCTCNGRRAAGSRGATSTLEETAAPPSRKVRLATVHYVPSGKSPKANCEEYAPLIAEAAKQKADLVVLGETVTYVARRQEAARDRRGRSPGRRRTTSATWRRSTTCTSSSACTSATARSSTTPPCCSARTAS